MQSFSFLAFLVFPNQTHDWPQDELHNRDHDQ